MDQVPLDPQMYQVVHAVLRFARIHGKDEAEVLAGADLLLTRARDKMIRLQAMNYVVQQVQRWGPHEFLRRKFDAQHSSTPNDMYVCISEFLEELVENWERTQ